VIIPAWNEEKYLPRLLDSIDAARARWAALQFDTRAREDGNAIVNRQSAIVNLESCLRGHDDDDIEVIVADNASTDRTGEIARARGCRVAFVEKRLIAAARNGGAKRARGEILCFVDADYRIHPNTFDHIDRVMSARHDDGVSTESHSPRRVISGPRREELDIRAATARSKTRSPRRREERSPSSCANGGKPLADARGSDAAPFRYIGGGTGLVLERKSLALRITLLAIMPLLLMLRIDGGVWFMRREAFEAVGGYDESQMISEDVRLLWALKRLGKRRRPRQKLATRFDAKKAGVPGGPALAICSTRKFDKHGDWHFLFDFYKAPLLYLFSRRRFEQYARSYWYEDER